MSINDPNNNVGLIWNYDFNKNRFKEFGEILARQSPLLAMLLH